MVVNDYAAECKALGPPGCLVGDGTTAYPDGRYDVKVLVKPGAVASTGTMDVNLHLVTNRYTAASAAADPSMARMRETLATYLARAGIALGAVNFVDELGHGEGPLRRRRERGRPQPLRRGGHRAAPGRARGTP